MLVVVGLGLLIVYVVRIVITLILIISGPLFLMCHALPHTEPLARWWWKAITAMLAIQVAQALVLITAVRTFLSGGVHLFGSTLSALGSLIGAIALFFILFKIPFWLLSAVKVSSGRSFLGGLARAYIAAKTFGMVAGRSGAFSAARGGGGAAAVRAPVAAAQARDRPTRRGLPSRASRPPPRRSTSACGRPMTPNAPARPAGPACPPRRRSSCSPNPSRPPTTPPSCRRNPGIRHARFSSAPTPATPPPASRRGPRPGSAPQFQAAGGPRRRGYRAASGRAGPRRVGTPAVAVPAGHSRTAAAVAPGPGRRPHLRAPVFRQAQPEPRIGDARRRTQSVPPPVFRAPKPAPGGDGT